MPATLPAPAAVARQFPADVRPAARCSPWVGILSGPLAVACVGTLLAALAYARFLEVAPHLWTSGIHDRNAHYWLGLGFGLDFGQGNLLHFLHDLHVARVWTPLHGLLVGMVLAVGGPDYRLAVLPSLAAWVGTAVFAFLAARRAVPRGGNLAGFTAALFVLASPAHQAFATDIMLESLGACLSLAVIYACLIAVQERSVGSGRLLGLALTALFFHKYNYYLLVVVALVAAAVLSDPRGCLHGVVDFFHGPARDGWHGQLAARGTLRWPVGLACWLKAQLRHPLTYVLVPILGFLVVAFWHGGGALQIGSWRVSMNAPHNVVHVAFCLLVLRVLPWWWRTGRILVRQLASPARQLVAWHLWPVILWFLWPQRLGYCLWYLTRDHGREATSENLSGGLAYYWNTLGADYHQGGLSLVLGVALLGVAILSWHRLRPGGGVVLVFVLVAAALTFHHPSHRSRFLHSWVAAGWVAAGIGLAQLSYSRLTAHAPRIRPWLGAAALVGLGLWQLPGMIQAGHAPEGGPRADRPSVLELTDAYLPALDNSNQPAIFANLPIKFLTGWTLRERRQQHVDVETEIKGFGSSPAKDRRCFESWLATTKSDAIVLIDLLPGSAFYEPVAFPDYRAVKELMAAEPRFTQASHMELPRQGCSVTIWRRASASPSHARVPSRARSAVE